MKYTKEIKKGFAAEYNAGKSLRHISTEKGIRYKYLQKIMKGYIIPRGRVCTNTHDNFMNNVFYAITGCWEWTAYINNKGYGQFSINGCNLLAHRYSYSYFKGDCTGFFVCHTCDNPKCVNPDHLFLGDYSINAADKAQKLRSANIKLTKENVLLARKLNKEGVKKTKIAELFNVSRYAITDIIRGKTWGWLK